MPDNNEYWAATSTSYRSIFSPEDLVEGETLVTGERPTLPILNAEEARAALISEADIIMADWIIDLQLGTITDDDRQKLIAWRAYKEELKALDLSSAPDIVWPPKPAV